MNKQIHIMEQMAARPQLKMDTFTQRWTRVSHYLGVNMQDHAC